MLEGLDGARPCHPGGMKYPGNIPTNRRFFTAAERVRWPVAKQVKLMALPGPDLEPFWAEVFRI